MSIVNNESANDEELFNILVDMANDASQEGNGMLNLDNVGVFECTCW